MNGIVKNNKKSKLLYMVIFFNLVEKAYTWIDMTVELMSLKQPVHMET